MNIRSLEILAEEGADNYYAKRRKKIKMKACTDLADYAFSIYVRAKEPFCVCCGSSDQLQCGHLFSRVFTSLRWEEMNAATQCARCNMNHEQHAEPFRRVMVGRHGEDAIEKMWDRRLDGKTNALQRLEIAVEYFRKYKELK